MPDGGRGVDNMAGQSEFDVARREMAADRSLDRRGLLKKAAIGGALAWSAPMISAGRADAAGCTPKCSHPNFTLTNIGGTPLLMSVEDACANTVTALGLGNANKVAIISVSGAAACPCSPSVTPIVRIGPVPANWYKGNSACPDTAGQPFCNALPYPGDPTKFYIYKNGALADGWYSPASAMCLSIGCKDAAGDMVWKNCTFTYCFQYSPSGACATPSPVSAVVVSNTTCTTACVDCSGSAA